MSHDHELNGRFHDGCVACELDKAHGKTAAYAPLWGVMRRGETAGNNKPLRAARADGGGEP